MAGFFPDAYLTSIVVIDPKTDLLDKGFKNLLLDVDNTILPRDTHQVSDEVKAWLKQAREAGLNLCLISNNFHHGVYEWAERLDLPIVAKAVKPLPHAFIRARRKMGFKRRETCMIGDQLITDVWGAHFTGMKCLLVQPLVDVDLKHTLLLRHVEKLFIGSWKPER